MKKFSVFLFVMLLFFGFAGMAKATLFDRGSGLIYDSDQDITWIQDAYSAGMLQQWQAARDWALDLEYWDDVRKVSWDDWRLPNRPTWTGEMRALWNSGVDSGDPSPFVNVKTTNYWYGTAYDMTAERAGYILLI